MDANILDLIRSNDHLTVSRLITHIENDKKISNSVLEEIYKYGKDALRIGITGPPGCGKSTLTDQLIKQILNDGQSVGVVAVDPTSPFTGGALLGDRVRMNNYIWNDDDFFGRILLSNKSLLSFYRSEWLVCRRFFMAR